MTIEIRSWSNSQEIQMDWTSTSKICLTIWQKWLWRLLNFFTFQPILSAVAYKTFCIQYTHIWIIPKNYPSRVHFRCLFLASPPTTAMNCRQAFVLTFKTTHSCLILCHFTQCLVNTVTLFSTQFCTVNACLYRRVKKKLNINKLKLCIELKKFKQFLLIYSL